MFSLFKTKTKKDLRQRSKRRKIMIIMMIVIVAITSISGMVTNKVYSRNEVNINNQVKEVKGTMKYFNRIIDEAINKINDVINGEDWKYKVSIAWDDLQNPYDKKDVVLTGDDIIIKYNISVSTNNVGYEAGEMQIRLPLSIWEKRNGEALLPSDYSLPKAPDVSNNYSFNYTIDDHGTIDDQSDDEIVVKNWTALPAAMNQTFSLSYKVVPLDTIDLSKTEIIAKASAKDNQSQVIENQDSNMISYQIDTGVNLENVTYSSCKLIYSYPSGYDIPREEFDPTKYNYVEYKSEFIVDSNQYGNITDVLTPSHNGKVVGYNSGKLHKVDDNTYQLNKVSSHSWSIDCFLVAYPRDNSDPNPEYSLQQDVFLDAYDIHPGHDSDADKNDHMKKVAVEKITWKDYEFSYTGEIDYLNKRLVSVNQGGLGLLRLGIDCNVSFSIYTRVYGYNIGQYRFETIDDAMYFYCNNKYYPLTEADYYISKIHFYIPLYWDIDRSNGDRIYKTVEPYSIYGYNIKNQEWDYIGQIIDGGDVELGSKDYAKFKVVSADNLEGACEVVFTSYVTIKSDSPTFKQVIAENPGEDITIKNFVGMKRYNALTGNWSNSYDEPYLDSATPPGLNQMDYEENKAYIFRDEDEALLTEIEYESKQSKALINTINDRVNSSATVTFGLYNYEAMTRVNNNDIKSKFQHSEGTFYDLLPLGYKFKGEESVKAYGTNSTTMNARVKTEVINNWRGSGRQMIIFHLKKGDYVNVSDNITVNTPWTYLFTNSKTHTGYSLTFEAEISWDDLKFYPTSTNLMAYQGNKYLGDKDQGTYSPHNKIQALYNGEMHPVFYDIDEDGDISEYTTYASSTFTPDINMTIETGISKKVSTVDNPHYENSGVVKLNDEYRYRIGVSCSSSGSMKDIIVYDILEEAQNTQGHSGEIHWKGLFKGIDVSNLTVYNMNPVVYYSTTVGLRYIDSDLDINDSSKWSTTPPDDLSMVTAIAVDMRKKNNGDNFNLDAGKAVSFEIKMKAPSQLLEAKYTYNRAAYHSYFIPSGSLIGSESTNIGQRTQVELDASVDIMIQKEDSEDASVLSGVEFELYKANEEWEKFENIPLKSLVSDDKGKLLINKLLPGKYLLYETKANYGYLCPSEPWKIMISNDSKISIIDLYGNELESTIQYGETIYHIKNKHAYVLPESGGVGTNSIYLIAVILIISSIIIIIAKRKIA